MRYLNLLLVLVMVGFAAVQYNDPDGLLWAAYYAVPATWAGLAAMRPEFLRTSLGIGLLWACLAAGLGLVLLYWPQVPSFWRKEVFMAEETAREGMGMMIAWGVLLVALITAKMRQTA